MLMEFVSMLSMARDNYDEKQGWLNEARLEKHPQTSKEAGEVHCVYKKSHVCRED